MEEKKFFREATLKICGTLEIDNALNTFYEFLKKVIPVSRMYLHYLEKNYLAMRTIAIVDESGSRQVDQLNPLSKKALEDAVDVPPDQDVFLIKRPNGFSVTREMQDFHGFQASSVLAMFLRLKTETVGYLCLASEGPETFQEEHITWLNMLKEPLVIAMSNARKHRELTKLKELLYDDNRYLQQELHRLSGDEIVGAQFGLKNVMYKVQQVAALESPVLLFGETGVGKEVIANYIHYSSTRNSGPFITVNCGAIPETLIDSELFGHEKGAFTGAYSQKRGRFERADKGTIFLDEIGELPLQAQVRLLRVLQSREIERVGGVKTIRLDIRVIAATNRDLEEMVKNGQFREDLWFRLNVFPVWIPPLRDRMEDIPALADHFIHEKVKEFKLPAIPALSADAMSSLMEYHWPGNVREMQNVIERALILNPRGPLSFEQAIFPTRKSDPAQAEKRSEAENLDLFVAQHIRRILIKTKGKINGKDGAAELMGINPNTLRNRMKKLGIVNEKLGEN